MKNIGILGCGWLGTELAKKLIKKSYSVYGTQRTFHELEKLNKIGVKTFLIDLSKTNKNDTLNFLNKIDQLIISIPPIQKNNFVDLITDLIGLISQSTIKKVVFLSSISVYGEQNGEIDESSLTMPITESAKSLIIAEEKFLRSIFDVTILRLGGLIGNDRHPIRTLINRTITNPNGYINFIHQLDAVKLICFLIEFPELLGIYNGVDPYHPNRKEYYTKVASLLKLSKPVFSDKKKFKRIVNSNKITLNNNFKFSVDNMLIDFLKK